MTYYLTMYTIALPSLVLLKKHKTTNMDVAKKVTGTTNAPIMWLAQIRLPDVRAPTTY